MHKTHALSVSLSAQLMFCWETSNAWHFGILAFLLATGYICLMGHFYTFYAAGSESWIIISISSSNIMRMDSYDGRVAWSGDILNTWSLQGVPGSCIATAPIVISRFSFLKYFLRISRPIRFCEFLIMEFSMDALLTSCLLATCGPPSPVISLL